MTRTMNHTIAAPSSAPIPADRDARPTIATLGLVDAARAIEQGEITAEGYATALLDMAAKNRDLNAFITIDRDGVLAAARAADRARAIGKTPPLAGLPIGVKDSYLTRGMATSLGLAPLARHVPQHDADILTALRASGLSVFGKNNLVEMSFGLTGHNQPFGQVRNPAAPDHVSGGSSSGSAASVAAFMVPASLGGDTIGSIRVPASLCGVAGFKPTTTRWPRAGVAPISHSLDTTGVLARHIRDCALIDHIVTATGTELPGKSGGDILAPFTGQAGPMDGAPLKGVRLAHAPRQFLHLLAPDVARNFDDTLGQLRAAGGEIVEIDLGDDFNALAQSACWNIFFHETMPSVSDFVRDHDIPLSFAGIVDALKPELQGAWRHMVMPGGGGAISRETYDHARLAIRPEITRRIDDALSQSGAMAIIQPTTPVTAPRIDQQGSFMIGETAVNDLVLANHTLVASLTGMPGISLPSGRSAAGLPFGIELDGPSGSDRQLLALAQQIEDVLADRP